MTHDEVNKWKEQQTERAMRNFKAKGSMATPDYSRKDQSARVPGKRTSGGERDLSSDSSIEAFVDKGVKNAFTVAEKSIKENLHPFAISFLLSLSAD